MAFAAEKSSSHSRGARFELAGRLPFQSVAVGGVAGYWSSRFYSQAQAIRTPLACIEGFREYHKNCRELGATHKSYPQHLSRPLRPLTVVSGPREDRKSQGVGTSDPCPP